MKQPNRIVRCALLAGGIVGLLTPSLGFVYESVLLSFYAGDRAVTWQESPIKLGQRVDLQRLERANCRANSGPCILVVLPPCGSCTRAPIEPSSLPERFGSLELHVVLIKGEAYDEIPQNCFIDTIPSCLPSSMKIWRPSAVQVDASGEIVRVFTTDELISLKVSK